MFSVCADGSVVWYFWCPGCRGEHQFLSYEDVRLCCAHEMLKFFHGAPYAIYVEFKNFYLFVFRFGGLVCFVCKSVWVWGCEDQGWVLLRWRRMEVCVMGICGRVGTCRLYSV